MCVFLECELLRMKPSVVNASDVLLQTVLFLQVLHVLKLVQMFKGCFIMTLLGGKSLK